jgi:hypothetical protein
MSMFHTKETKFKSKKSRPTIKSLNLLLFRLLKQLMTKKTINKSERTSSIMLLNIAMSVRPMNVAISTDKKGTKIPKIPNKKVSTPLPRFGACGAGYIKKSGNLTRRLYISLFGRGGRISLLAQQKY